MELAVIFVLKLAFNNHLIYYPVPININYGWCFGFLISIAIIIQILSGLILACKYTSDISLAYFSVEQILDNSYNGFLFRYLHSNNASFIFLLIYNHISKSIIYGSSISHLHIFISGMMLFIFFMAIAFLGYILPWGQMSYWGATVLTNAFSFLPLLLELICGNYLVANATLHRFYIIHFLLPFIILIILLFHLLYLHNYSSSNPMINKQSITFIFFIIKDNVMIPLFIILLLQQILGPIIQLSHYDNMTEVNAYITPLFILPEWYLLSFYAIIKAIPNKILGLIVITSIPLHILFTLSPSL